MATLISRDDCRKVAFEYFLAAVEAGDEDKRGTLLEVGRKWVRLAAQISGNQLPPMWRSLPRTPTD
jgi:hypothetical protein